MKHFISNNQDSLAEEFLLNDVLITRCSYQGVLKIKRWKFIMRMPGIGALIKDEAESSIRHAFFAYVSASFVLLEEEYYFNHCEN